MSSSSHQNENLQPRTALKKVKVMCQLSKDPNQLGSPQPLLSSSNSQKNINMVKALQQINQMMSSQNSISSMSQLSTANIINQPNLKTTHSTKNLFHQQQQHQLHSQNSQQQLKILAKSPKPMPQNLINIPLSLKSSQNNQAQLKFKQLQQKASGILMQKCESHQSLLQYHSATNQKTASKQKVQGTTASKQEKQNGSLSPCDKNEKSQSRTNKHNRQSSMINFNVINNIGSNQHQMIYQNSQKSLSPINKVNDHTGSKYQTQSRQNNERVKSLDSNSLETIQRGMTRGQHQNMMDQDKENRAAQLIRVSPQKQFFVQPCLTQQTSPQEMFRKHSTRIQLKNPHKTNQNLILEQEDYQLPQNSQEYEDELQQYSLKKDYQTLVHHNHKMSKDNQSVGKYPRESEESINRGFLTDRQQASNQEIQNMVLDMQPQHKKTKGISYTRNAQELKKLLLETGVIGNLGLTSSLATAAAGMISQTQDTLFIKNNDITTKTTKNPHKSQTSKVKSGEVFSFSSKGKSSKNITDKYKKQEVMNTCLMENQMLMKKGQHHRLQSQLENSVQTQKITKNSLYQTLDQNQDHAIFPSSTQNKLREFILKDDEETPHKQYQNFIDDQVIYNTKRLSKSPQNIQGFHNIGMASRRSPSSQVALKEDSQSNINFPFTETEQFIHRAENKRTLMYSGSVVDIQNQHQQKQMNRCWTAHGDISTERDRQKQYVLLEFNGNNGNQQDIRQYSDNSHIDSMGGAPISVKGLIKNNHHAQSHIMMQKRQSCNSSHSKNTCFTYNQQAQHPPQSPMNKYHFSSMISDENQHPNKMLSSTIPQTKTSIQNSEMTSKELEILKFKMIAFVKTYENEFQKMKMQMKDMQQENQQLKKKLKSVQSRRMSASTSTAAPHHHNSQYSLSINKVVQNHHGGHQTSHTGANTCLTSVQTSQIMH
eukprot:403334798